MNEHLKDAIMSIDRSLVEVSMLIRSHDNQLTEDEIADLFIVGEVQSRALAQLVNIGKRISGNDDFLSELEDEKNQWKVDTYPGDEDEDDDEDENDDVLKQFIDANPL